MLPSFTARLLLLLPPGARPLSPLQHAAASAHLPHRCRPHAVSWLRRISPGLPLAASRPRRGGAELRGPLGAAAPAAFQGAVVYSYLSAFLLCFSRRRSPEGTARPVLPPKGRGGRLLPRGLPRAPVVAFPVRGVVAGGPRRDPGEGKMRSLCPRSLPAALGTSRWRNLCSTLLAGALGQGWEPCPPHPAASRGAF